MVGSFFGTGSGVAKGCIDGGTSGFVMVQEFAFSSTGSVSLRGFAVVGFAATATFLGFTAVILIAAVVFELICEAGREFLSSGGVGYIVRARSAKATIAIACYHIRSAFFDRAIRAVPMHIAIAPRDHRAPASLGGLRV